MSRREAPLAYRTLRATGDVVVHAELILEVKTNSSEWQSITFVVDPGTEMTSMPAGVAKVRNLPIPRRPVQGRNLKGQEVHSGLLRARIPGMDATEYVFPCDFLGDPNVLPADTANLLGLTGVINQIRLTFDGIYSLVAPHGVLVVEKK